MNDSRIVPVFQILAEDIHALGIRTVFGLMSDDTAVFAVTLEGLGVKFVGARHENNAIAMAEGYAYSTGELGVAIIGRGPATANGLHAAVAASRTGSKVLVIYGDAAAGSGAVNGIGPDYKGFNAQAVLSAAGLTCFTAASAATARQTLVDAVAAASHGTLAALLLPTNVQMMNVEVWGPTTPKLAPAGQPTGARRQSIDAAAALLRKSRRPVIVAGMSFVLACTGNAQREKGILSKADAAEMFAQTRQQWRANLSATVRAGYRTRVGDALTLRTPDGAVTTLPVYSHTDWRPSRLEVTNGQRPCRGG